MAGIYLHIPFCKKACHYCNFYFSTWQQSQPAVLKALAKEIELRADYLNRQPLYTIYFGGGTPSLIPAPAVESLLNTIQEHIGFSAGTEITLEANPDDINPENCQAWQQAGINRLSIGVQSFVDQELRWMNRIHTAEQSLQSLITAKQFFDKISIDLIYGLPHQSLAQWQANVEQALSLKIAHLSCYALTVEPRTALEKKIRTQQTAPVNPDNQSAYFLLLMNWMEKAGYRHYEISNFALPGKESRHNSSYWQGDHYLGIGPSAHSFNGHSRQWNLSNNALYVQSVENQQLSFEQEILTPVQQLNEYIMTALRTDTGIELCRLGEDQLRVIRQAHRYILSGHVQLNEKRLWLTQEGKLLADGIASDLFAEEKGS